MNTFTVYADSAKDAAYEARTYVGLMPTVTVKRLATTAIGTQWKVTVN